MKAVRTKQRQLNKYLSSSIPSYKARIYNKKKRKIYQEGNEKEQKEFQEKIKDIPPEKMIWLDETGIEG